MYAMVWPDPSFRDEGRAAPGKAPQPARRTGDDLEPHLDA